MQSPDDWEADGGLDEGLEERLDEEFPLGDGVADLESQAMCPYCGEVVELTLDPGSGAQQEYIEDCSVCCRPWRVTVNYQEDGSAYVHLDANDDQ